MQESDELEVSRRYFNAHGFLPDLQHPTSFTEKIQWRKLNDRDPRLARLADKLLVKEYVAAALGDDWVTPALWSGHALPPRSERCWPIPYVLKANHGYNFNHFVMSERDEDWSAIEVICDKWLSEKFGQSRHEWLYSQIEPKLLVEPFIGPEDNRLPTDYKLFVYNGFCPYIEVINNLVDDFYSPTYCGSFYDRDWNYLPAKWQSSLEPTSDLIAPASLRSMLGAAELLGRDFSFVRVDFFDVYGTPRFGEMTFYPWSGLQPLEPRSFDDILGSFWSLPRSR